MFRSIPPFARGGRLGHRNLSENRCDVTRIALPAPRIKYGAVQHENFLCRELGAIL
jgi:hypothetical protein